MSIARAVLRPLLTLLLWPMVRMPGRSYAGPIQPLTDEEAALSDRLRAHIDKLAGEIGERHVFRYDALEASVDYLIGVLRAAGYEEPGVHEFEVLGKTLKNIEVEVKGVSRPDEIIVIGAHYDTVLHCPGADDNTSGTAATLELARLLREMRAGRTVRFVLFANEEHPTTPPEEMGSYYYARRCRQRGEKVVAMYVLEMLGYFSNEAGSQKYPFPFSLIYPDRGNFIAFVGNSASKRQVREGIAAFRKHAKIGSQGGALPELVKDIQRSDHWSFWEFGYPGVMITDTANFRNPNYHTPADTPDKLDFERMTRVVVGLAGMVKDLAG